jgi:hypothetical protein
LELNFCPSGESCVVDLCADCQQDTPQIKGRISYLLTRLIQAVHRPLLAGKPCAKKLLMQQQHGSSLLYRQQGAPAPRNAKSLISNRTGHGTQLALSLETRKVCVVQLQGAFQ